MEIPAGGNKELPSFSSKRGRGRRGETLGAEPAGALLLGGRGKKPRVGGVSSGRPNPVSSSQGSGWACPQVSPGETRVGCPPYPLPSGRRHPGRGAGVAGGPSPCGATWRARAKPWGKILARGEIWGGGGHRAGGTEQSCRFPGWHRERRRAAGGGGRREGRRQAGAWGAPAPPAACPLRPGRAERPPAQASPPLLRQASNLLLPPRPCRS